MAVVSGTGHTVQAVGQHPSVLDRRTDESRMIHMGNPPLQQLLPGQGSGFLNRGHPQRRQVCTCFRLGQSGKAHIRDSSDSAAALHNRFGYHALGQRRSEQRLNAHSPGGLTSDGDIIRVTTKGGNVPPNPLQSENLVQQAVVAGHMAV